MVRAVRCRRLRRPRRMSGSAAQVATAAANRCDSELTGWQNPVIAIDCSDDGSNNKDSDRFCPALE